MLLTDEHHEVSYFLHPFPQGPLCVRGGSIDDLTYIVIIITRLDIGSQEVTLGVVRKAWIAHHKDLSWTIGSATYGTCVG